MDLARSLGWRSKCENFLRLRLLASPPKTANDCIGRMMCHLMGQSVPRRPTKHAIWIPKASKNTLLFATFRDEHRVRLAGYTTTVPMSLQQDSFCTVTINSDCGMDERAPTTKPQSSITHCKFIAPSNTTCMFFLAITTTSPRGNLLPSIGGAVPVRPLFRLFSKQTR